MSRTRNETVQSQFRLKPETLVELDLIAKYRTEETGVEHSRTDAVRWAAHEAAKKIRRKIGESG